MNSYEFTLRFTLPHRNDEPERYLDALYQAGCDDAAVGVGQYGVIGLDFHRSACSAEQAFRTAIENVHNAIPGATPVEAGPDLVGLSEMADLFGFSRQNMRKYATGPADARAPFPAPTILGDPSLWHLAEVAAWFKQNNAIQLSPSVFEASMAAARINFEAEGQRLTKILELA